MEDVERRFRARRGEGVGWVQRRGAREGVEEGGGVVAHNQAVNRHDALREGKVRRKEYETVVDIRR